MSAEQIINEQWGLAIPPIPQAFTQVVDVCAVAFSVLKTQPTLMQRWQQMKASYDSFLQVRRGGFIDLYYQITKENQLAAVLLMNPNASETQLFDMCIGVNSFRPVTVRELQTQAQDSQQLREAEALGTAAGFVPKGL